MALQEGRSQKYGRITVVRPEAMRAATGSCATMVNGAQDMFEKPVMRHAA